MKFGFQSLALVFTFALALSACQVPTNPRVASASNLPIAGAGGRPRAHLAKLQRG
jgi:hypothetical protein